MNGYNLEYIQKLRIHELRDFARSIGISSPTTLKKEELIDKIKDIMSINEITIINEKSSTQEPLDFFSLLTSPNSNLINELIIKSSKNDKNEIKPNENGDLSNTLVMKKSTLINPNTPYAYSSNDFIGLNFNVRQNQASYGKEVSEVEGYLDIHENGYGIVRYRGFVPDSRDVYLTLALVKKYNLKKGDYVKGKVKYILENKPKVMFEIISVDGNPDTKKFLSYDNCSYKKLGKKFYLEKNNFDIQRGDRIFIKNMSISETLDLGYELVDENGVNVKLINIKSRPEEIFESHQKMEIINIPFNKTEIETVETVNLVIERTKREFENNKPNVIIIYNFNEFIRMSNVAIEGFYSFEKFNAKAINQIVNTMYIAKYFDDFKNITLICIDNAEMPMDMKPLVESELLPLFNKQYNTAKIK